MKDWRSQSHVKWDCRYHVVIVPKCRQRVFFGKQRSQIGEILRSRGYCVSTVGLDEAMIRRDIQDQEKHVRDQERGLFDNLD